KKNLGLYIQELCSRVAFIDSWVESPSCPRIINVNHLFYPRKFIVAFLQRYARRHQLAIDSVTFTSHVVKDSSLVDTSNSDDCFIRGLHLEGARWNEEKNILEEPCMKQLYSPMPVICLKPNAQRG